MTPPLDEEVENNTSRSIESQARKVLENEGCPPCYPTYLEIPLRDPPQKYRPITSYWKSFPGTGDVVLRAQLSDWKRFREFQKAVRRYYRHRTFSEFLDQVRERRRKHGLGGNACLRFDLEQSPLETWFEFQDWHLQHLEGFEKNRNELRNALDNAGQEAEGGGAAEEAEAYRQDLEHAEWELKRHNTLLHWTEQERLARDSEYPTPVEEENPDDWDATPRAVRSASASGRRKRQLEAPAVLGPVRVSKVKRGKRNTPRQERKTIESDPGIEDLDTAESSISQAPQRRDSKPRRTKTETALYRHGSQRVSKRKRFADANARTRRMTRQKRSPDQARYNRGPPPQWPRPRHVNVITRFGRVSRRPERWGFSRDGQTL